MVRERTTHAETLADPRDAVNKLRFIRDGETRDVADVNSRLLEIGRAHV